MKRDEKSINLVSQHSPTLMYLHFLMKTCLFKFSKLISNLFDKIYDVLSMISNSSLACSLGTLPPTRMYLHAHMQTCMFKISKLSFNTIDRAYAALTTMFSFLPAGFDRAFNFFFNIMICDKFLEASNLQFLTNL